MNSMILLEYLIESFWMHLNAMHSMEISKCSEVAKQATEWIGVALEARGGWRQRERAI